MIGRIKNISRFGLFITFKQSDLSEIEQNSLNLSSNDVLLTGLLRWKDLPRDESYQKNDVLAIQIKTIQEDGKINLARQSENFREKYAAILERTSETLQVLHHLNQGRKVNDDKK